MHFEETLRMTQRHYSMTSIVDTTHICCPVIIALDAKHKALFYKRDSYFNASPIREIVDARNFSDSFAAQS